MNFRPLADNVLLMIEEQPKETASGLALVHNRSPGAREHRTARVIASGPGYTKGCCKQFIPNTVKPGDRVIVDALCGDKLKWDFDVSEVRQNSIPEFDHVGLLRGQMRVVRESEILAVVEDDVSVAAE